MRVREGPTGQHFRGVCPRGEADAEGGADRGGEDIREPRVCDCCGVCAGRPVPVAERRGKGGGGAWLRDARLAAREGGEKCVVKGGWAVKANKTATFVGSPRRMGRYG